MSRDVAELDFKNYLPGVAAPSVSTGRRTDRGKRSSVVKSARMVFRGHQSAVLAVDVLPSVQRDVLVVSAGDDRCILVWSAATGKLCANGKGHSARVSGVKLFSPKEGEAYVVSGSWDETVRIWNVSACYCESSRMGLSAHETLLELTSKVLTGHKNRVYTVDVLEIPATEHKPTEHYILSGSADGRIRVWSFEKETVLFKLFDENFTWIFTLKAFRTRRYGDIVVSGGKDHLVRVWPIAKPKSKKSSTKPLRVISEHRSKIECVDVFNDPKHTDCPVIVTTCRDLAIRMWSMHTGELLRELHGHLANINSVAVFRSEKEGTLLTSAASDGNVRIWNTQTGDLVRQFNGHRSVAHCVRAFECPDESQQLVVVSGSADATVRTWLFAESPALTVITHTHSGVSGVTTDTRRLSSSAHTSSSSSAARGTAAARGAEGAENREGQESSRGAEHARHGNPSGGSRVRVRAVVVHTTEDSDMDTVVVSGCDDGTIRAWKIASETNEGALLWQSSAHKKDVACLDLYSPPPFMIREATLNLIRHQHGHSHQRSPQRNQDHQGNQSEQSKDLFAAMAVDNFDKDTFRGEERREQGAADADMHNRQAGMRKYMAAERERENEQEMIDLGRPVIVSGSRDRTMVLTDVHSGATIRVLRGHADHLTSVAVFNGWSPLPSACTDTVWPFAVSGSEDNTARVWCLRTGSCLYALEGHMFDVSCVCVYFPLCYMNAIAKIKRKAMAAIAASAAAAEAQNENENSGSNNNNKPRSTSSVFSSATGRAATGGDGSPMVRPRNNIGNAAEVPGSFRTGSALGYGLGDITSAGQNPGVVLSGLGDLEGLAYVPQPIIVTGSMDNSCRLWVHDEMNSEEGGCDPLQVLEEEGGTHVTCVTSLDIRKNPLLAAGNSDGEVVLYSLLAPFERMRILTGHKDEVQCVVMADVEGMYPVLASGSWDTTIHVWNLRTLLFVKRIEGHSAEVADLSIFSSGGGDAAIASVSGDATLQVVYDFLGNVLKEEAIRRAYHYDLKSKNSHLLDSDDLAANQPSAAGRAACITTSSSNSYSGSYARSRSSSFFSTRISGASAGVGNRWPRIASLVDQFGADQFFLHHSALFFAALDQRRPDFIQQFLPQTFVGLVKSNSPIEWRGRYNNNNAQQHGLDMEDRTAEDDDGGEGERCGRKKRRPSFDAAGRVIQETARKGSRSIQQAVAALAVAGSAVMPDQISGQQGYDDLNPQQQRSLKERGAKLWESTLKGKGRGRIVSGSLAAAASTSCSSSSSPASMISAMLTELNESCSLLKFAIMHRDKSAVRVIVRCWVRFFNAPHDGMDRNDLIYEGSGSIVAMQDLLLLSEHFPREFENFICGVKLVPARWNHPPHLHQYLFMRDETYTLERYVDKNYEAMTEGFGEELEEGLGLRKGLGEQKLGAVTADLMGDAYDQINENDGQTHQPIVTSSPTLTWKEWISMFFASGGSAVDGSTSAGEISRKKEHRLRDLSTASPFAIKWREMQKERAAMLKKKNKRKQKQQQNAGLHGLLSATSTNIGNALSNKGRFSGESEDMGSRLGIKAGSDRSGGDVSRKGARVHKHGRSGGTGEDKVGYEPLLSSSLSKTTGSRGRRSSTGEGGGEGGVDSDSEGVGEHADEDKSGEDVRRKAAEDGQRSTTWLGRAARFGAVNSRYKVHAASLDSPSSLSTLHIVTSSHTQADTQGDTQADTQADPGTVPSPTSTHFPLPRSSPSGEAGGEDHEDHKERAEQSARKRSDSFDSVHSSFSAAENNNDNNSNHDSPSLKEGKTFIQTLAELNGVEGGLNAEALMNSLLGSSDDDARPKTFYWLPLQHPAHMDMLRACANVCVTLDSVEIFDSEAGKLLLGFAWRSFGFASHSSAMMIYFMYVALAAANIYNFDSLVSRGGTAAWIGRGLSVLVIAYDLYFLRQEFSEMRRFPREYFSDVWNQIDGIVIFGSIAGSVLRLLYDRDTNVSKSVLSIVSVAMWFNVLYYLRAFESTGPLVSMILRIARDMRSLLLVLIIVVTGFAQAFWLVSYTDPAMPFSTVSMSFLNSYSFMLGSFDPLGFDGLPLESLGLFLSCMFMLVGAILLLNLLIALMSDSYADVKSKGNAQWRLEQAQLIGELFPAMATTDTACMHPIYTCKFTAEIDDSDEEEEEEDEAAAAETVEALPRKVRRMREELRELRDLVRDQQEQVAVVTKMAVAGKTAASKMKRAQMRPVGRGY